MRTLVWSRSFTRALKRKIKENPVLKGDVEDTLRLLVKDPFATRLATHKLKGKLSGTLACTVAYDLRILFEFIESDEGDAAIFLMELGTYDEVY